MFSSLAIASAMSILPKAILLFFSIFTALFGVLFAFSPDTITRLSKWAHTVIFPATDKMPGTKLVGALLLVLGLGMAVVFFCI